MVKTADMVKALGLEILYLGNDDSLHIETSEVSRPGLQLAGYWDYFARERTQLIGKAEASYLETLEEKDRRERIRKLMSYDIPCVIICRGMECFPEMLEAAQERGVPVFRSKENYWKAMGKYYSLCVRAVSAFLKF